MKNICRVLLLLLPLAAFGNAGVLLPRDKSQPNAAVLSLEEMRIDVRVDNGDARVSVLQIYANHTGNIEEGTYIFALPSRATISDFATWDGPTRIPGVIMERKRAEEIYANLKAQAIDPGLLQVGEPGADEARRTAAFSARIVPIPAYGTKRVEIEYQQTIPVEGLKSYFAIPLRPEAYGVLTAAHLSLSVEMTSAHAMRNLQLGSKLYPIRFDQQDAHTVRGRFEGQNVKLAEDFSLTWELDSAQADALKVIAHRKPEGDQPPPTEIAPIRTYNEPGFFEAQALIGHGKGSGAEGAARNIVVLFDNSLSMQWDKLERNFAALERLLRSLRPQDRFNLLLFNTQITSFRPATVPADSATVTSALEFVRASRLRGGTDLQKGLETALGQCNAPNSYLVLLSDVDATRGPINTAKLGAWFAARWKQLPESNRPRVFVFAVGDDANLSLARTLARNQGVVENVLNTEPIDFKLGAFLSKIGRSPVAGLTLGASPDAALSMIYPLQDNACSGSMARWVGQYKQPASVNFSVRGVRDGQPIELRTTASLPQRSLEHPQLPRVWARARVDALLDYIEKNGEDRASVDEIIRLSRKYKFVTPYTSFLAAPRAILRPRVIRPGDPILRVRTDEAIVSVVALFPFGLTKPLRKLEKEDVWQTRFLAPAEMQDGTYAVRLILRDRNGNTYREQKTFVIASKPPIVQVNLDRKRFHRGETVALKANASQSTRTLTAKLEGAAAVKMAWDERARTNVGMLEIPSTLQAGSYKLTVIAEDIAHNIGTQEVQVEIVP